jgi:hypothetical protein
MTSNDTWTMSPEMLGYGNSNNSFYNNQTQSTEGAELAEYIRITKNYDSLTISLLLEGLGFIPTSDKQRFNELYPKYGNGKEALTGSNESSKVKEDDFEDWNWDLYSESRRNWVEGIKAKEGNKEAIELIEVNEVPDVLPDETAKEDTEETENHTCTPIETEVDKQEETLGKFDLDEIKDKSVKQKMKEHASMFYSHKKKGLKESEVKGNGVGYLVLFNGIDDILLDRSINNACLRFFIFLLKNTDHEKGYLFHSNKTLAKMYGVSEKQIRKYFVELSEHSLIERLLRFDNSPITLIKPIGHKSKK